MCFSINFLILKYAYLVGADVPQMDGFNVLLKSGSLRGCKIKFWTQFSKISGKAGQLLDWTKISNWLRQRGSVAFSIWWTSYGIKWNHAIVISHNYNVVSSVLSLCWGSRLWWLWNNLFLRLGRAVKGSFPFNSQNPMHALGQKMSYFLELLISKKALFFFLKWKHWVGEHWGQLQGAINFITDGETPGLSWEDQ